MFISLIDLTTYLCSFDEFCATKYRKPFVALIYTALPFVYLKISLFMIEPKPT